MPAMARINNNGTNFVGSQAGWIYTNQQEQADKKWDEFRFIHFDSVYVLLTGYYHWQI